MKKITSVLTILSNCKIPTWNLVGKGLVTVSFLPALFPDSLHLLKHYLVWTVHCKFIKRNCNIMKCSGDVQHLWRFGINMWIEIMGCVCSSLCFKTTIFVMLNGVLLPSTVFEKVVWCWKIHSRLLEGDIKCWSREKGLGAGLHLYIFGYLNYMFCLCVEVF